MDDLIQTNNEFREFTRAFEEDCSDSWQHLFDQYRKLMIHWIHAVHPRPEELNDYVIEDLVQNAWIKFWKSLSNNNLPFTDRFERLNQVLEYLKRCVVTSCLEYLRAEKQHLRVSANLDILRESADPDFDLFEDKDERIALVRSILSETMKTHAEEIVYTESFGLGTKPSKIAEKYPDLFQSTDEIYVIKKRMISRVKRGLKEYHYRHQPYDSSPWSFQNG